LSTASRYGALEAAFNAQLREWHLQRSQGALYQLWLPPGIVFGRLRRDHYEHGKYAPLWSEWGFKSDSTRRPLRLVLRALAGHWAVWQARQNAQDRWVVADGDDGNFFNAYCRAMNCFHIDPDEPTNNFPNLRLLHVIERHAPKFFKPQTLNSIHVHLPWSERVTRPRRQALVTPQFISDACDALHVHGELHIVADDEAVVEQVTSSRFGDSDASAL